MDRIIVKSIEFSSFSSYFYFHISVCLSIHTKILNVYSFFFHNKVTTTIKLWDCIKGDPRFLSAMEEAIIQEIFSKDSELQGEVISGYGLQD